MASTIIGRDAELASIRDFVAGLPDGPVGLVLEGEAGAGKTTLWRAAIDEAAAAGTLLLQAQPVESETTLSLTGVADLLEPVLDDVLERLPAAQRRAVTRALVLEDEEDASLDPRALRVAVLNGLRSLAEARPVLLAIDDSQWLDYASSAALAYGLRRLQSEPVGLLLARRAGVESMLLDELLRSPVGDRFRRVEVGALDPLALGRIVQEHLVVTLPRPLLAEVHAAAGGNPFYALELVRMLRRTGFSIEAGHPIPLPESLQDLVESRVRALPTTSQKFLLAAAAQAHPTLGVTEAASGVARDVGLPPAFDARLVELDGERIRFRHPLLAAGVYQAATSLRRLEVHRRLADLLEDPEARAWQLAAGSVEPDEAVAAALEEAARHARARGAPRPAALLLDRARELTPPERHEEACARAVEAAYLHFESGDSRRAEAQLREVIAALPEGAQRARALVRLARVRSYEAQAEAAEIFLRAIDEAGDDSEVRALAHEGAAACYFRLRERLHEAVEHAQRAIELAFELGDEALAAEATGTRLISETLLGRESAVETAARALQLQPAARERRALAQPILALAVHWWWTDELERAQRTLADLLRLTDEMGDESSLPYILVLLGRVECALGRFEDACGRARQGREAAEQSGQETLAAYNLGLEALVEAHRGRRDGAVATAREALARAVATGGRPAEHLAREALAHAALAGGEPEEAVAWLAPVVESARKEQLAEPAADRFVVDYLEALLELGRMDEAAPLLDWYDGNATRLGRSTALANALRVRGLVAAQEGRLDDGLAAFAEAIEWHGRVDVPLDRGRTLLALGAAQRRAKRRRDARATLEEALAVFERIGAALWARRAGDELRRISGRAPSAGALTPAEERVAALVAEGKTNREVAAALFLSERTVEGHLSRMFAKLGVRSRVELARRVRPPEHADAP